MPRCSAQKGSSPRRSRRLRLTGHQLKDPTATVAYHTTDQDEFDRVLGSRGVQRAEFANRAVAVENDLDEIVQAIQLIVNLVASFPGGLSSRRSSVS